MEKLYNKFKNINKIYAVSFLVIAILIVAVASSSLARFKHRVSFLGSEVWSGNASLSYHSGTGTKDNPYVITNGEELMFFAENLKDNDYANTYFVLNKDIILNDEIFSYDTNKGVTYQKDNNIYTVDFNKDSYDDIHKFSPLNNFKGTFDGDMHTIYGLFLTGEEDLALFNNLSGTVKNLYLENTLIYGNNIVSALALKTDNAVVENVLINGTIIGSNNDNITSKEYPIEAINITENRTIQRPRVENIISLTLNGTYQNDNNTSIYINSEEITPGDFNISLDSALTEDLILGNEGNLSNLKYTITFNNKVSTTFAYESNNTTFKNIINKASVYGKENASGFIHNANNTHITRGYDTGNVTGNIVSGMVYSADSLELNNVYFNGTLNGNENYSFLVNNLNGQTNLNNIVNLSDNYLVKNNYADINISGVSYYNKNILNSLDTGITIVNSNIEDHLKELNYLDYEDDYSDDNIWVYGEDNMPILYFDDAITPLATLKINDYSWTNSSEEIDTIKIDNNFSFIVEENSSIPKVKEVYYAIENNITDVNNIAWTTYNGSSTVSEKGYYVIYIKLIDTKDEVTYINSDLIALGDVSTIALNINGQKYDSLRSDLLEQYVSSDPSFNIEIYDQNNVKDLYYLIANEVYPEDKLNTMPWNSYTGEVKVTNESDSIVYILAIDYEGNKTFINSNILSKQGFLENNLSTNENVVYIASNNKVKLNFKYEGTSSIEGVKALNFNKPLLKGTSIILIDNATKKVYKHDVIDTPNKIYLNTFKEIGIKETKYFLDTAKANEDYTVIIDFKDAIITNNIENLNVKLEIEKNKIPILSTLDETLVNINIIKDTISEKSISTSFTGPIYYNQNMTYSVGIIVNRNLLSYNGNNILSLNDNTIIVATLIDEDGNIVEDSYLNNLEFKMDDTKYYYDSGKVKFDVKDSNNAVIEITTYDSSNALENGEYSLKIGIINGSEEVYYITIPLIVNSDNNDISIEMISDKSIRKQDSIKLDFDVMDREGYDIRVLLYKKKELTAYDQEYILIDIDEYLNKITEEENKLTIDLNSKKLENNGYMFGFELYKDNEKIGEIDKKFIVR